MAYIKTKIGMKKRAEATSVSGTIAKVSQLAIGNGGKDASDTPKNIDPDAVTLFSEIKRKPVTVVKIDDSTYQFYAEFDASSTDADLVGNTINEAGLIDEDGDFVFLETFSIFSDSLPANFKDKHVIVISFI